MDPERTASPFPVAPADVPRRAVNAVRRTLLRSAEPDPELIAAVVLAALCGGGCGTFEITVTVPDRDGPLMVLAATEGDVGALTAFAVAQCREIPKFEVTVRPLR